MKVVGRRTYGACIFGIATLVTGFINADVFTVGSFANLIQEALPYIVGCTLRAGINSKL